MSSTTVFRAQVTIAANNTGAFELTAGAVISKGSILVEPPIIVDFTAQNAVSYAVGTSQTLDLIATAVASTAIVNAKANLVLYTSPTNTASVTGQPAPAAGPVSFLGFALTSTQAANATPASSAAATTASTSTQPTETASTPTSSTQTNPTQTSTTSIAPSQSGYGAGALAGAAVGCALGGILLTALIFFLVFRKRLSKKQSTSRSPENGRPLLQGHGEAVYVASGAGWEKHLPQADADSTIKSMTSRTLDQIAMHVENFYTSRGNVALSTEHEFELETVDSSPLSEPISTVMRRHERVEELIKHYMSGYIVSMIDFEGSGRSGDLLPKAFRRQWQAASEGTPAFSQAYARWRIVTAYLRQNSNDEQAWLAERDSMISTAARHVCKAFEPWAKADESVRFQNLVGIMKRASELGVQLFSQPARFEWQWFATNTDRSGTSNQLVVLPGLYKVSDQSSVPLTHPLHLVEPLMIPFDSRTFGKPDLITLEPSATTRTRGARQS